MKQQKEDSIYDEILSFFGFQSSFHKDKYKELCHFIEFVKRAGSYQEFLLQFNNYKNYKLLSEEKIHGFKSFLGSHEKDYSDGGWCAENWDFKLKGIKKQKNQTEFQMIELESLEIANTKFKKLTLVSNELDMAIKDQGGYKNYCLKSGYCAKIKIGDMIYLAKDLLM